MLVKMDFPINFSSEYDKISLIKFKFLNVSIKVERVEMDSTPSNCIGAPKLSKYNNFIIFFENPD